MKVIALFGLDVAGLVVFAWMFYDAGRRRERRKMRDENGWWAGFRAGTAQTMKRVQHELLEAGIVLTYSPGKPPSIKQN